MLSQGPFTYNRFDVLAEKAKPDFLDMDKDGDKKESMKKASKDKDEKCDDCGKKDCGCDDKKSDKKDSKMPPWLKKEEVQEIEFSDAADFLIGEGICKDVNGAEMWLEHAAPETLDALGDRIQEYRATLVTEISDELATQVSKKRQKRVERSVAGSDSASSTDRTGMFGRIVKGDGFGRQNHKRNNLNKTIDARNKRLGSNIPRAEEVSITKDDVLQHLIENDYVNNVVSAEAMFNHISDEFLESIEEDIMEIYQGKHGQSETQYQDGRSPAGKLISGDSKGSGANYSYRAKNTGPNPAGGSQKPQGQAKMNNKDRAFLAHQKANKKKGY